MRGVRRASRLRAGLAILAVALLAATPLSAAAGSTVYPVGDADDRAGADLIVASEVSNGTRLTLRSGDAPSSARWNLTLTSPGWGLVGDQDGDRAPDLVDYRRSWEATASPAGGCGAAAWLERDRVAVRSSRDLDLLHERRYTRQGAGAPATGCVPSGSSGESGQAITCPSGVAGRRGLAVSPNPFDDRAGAAACRTGTTWYRSSPVDPGPVFAVNRTKTVAGGDAPLGARASASDYDLTVHVLDPGGGERGRVAFEDPLLSHDTTSLGREDLTGDGVADQLIVGSGDFGAWSPMASEAYELASAAVVDGRTGERAWSTGRIGPVDGAWIHPAGDVDGDGGTDVVVSSYAASVGPSHVRVLSGADGTVVQRRSFDALTAATRFGDADGDDRDELLLAQQRTAGGVDVVAVDDDLDELWRRAWPDYPERFPAPIGKAQDPLGRARDWDGDGRVELALSDRDAARLDLVDGATGETAWTVDLGETDAGRCTRLTPNWATGRRAWPCPIPGTGFAVADRTGEVSVRDGATGATKWRTQIDGLAGDRVVLAPLGDVDADGRRDLLAASPADDGLTSAAVLSAATGDVLGRLP